MFQNGGERLAEVFAADVTFETIELEVAMEASNVLVGVVGQMVTEESGGEVTVESEEAAVGGFPGAECVNMTGREGGVGATGAIRGRKAMGGETDGAGDGDNKGWGSRDVGAP
jgi:hypothetical protein